MKSFRLNNRGFAKDLIAGAIFIYTINQAVPPFYAGYLTVTHPAPRITQEHASPLLQDSASHLEILAMANKLTHAQLSSDYDCKQSATTMYAYLRSIVPDQMRRYRLAAGHVIENEHTVGHMWIEYLEDDRWIPYETTFPTTTDPRANLEIYAQEEYVAYIHTLPGTRIPVPRADLTIVDPHRTGLFHFLLTSDMDQLFE